MKPNQFSSDVVVDCQADDGDDERFLGVELTLLPGLSVPWLPARNVIGSFIFARLLQGALERENLICSEGVACAGALNEAGFVAVVKELGKSYQVLADVLKGCSLGPLAVYGYFDPRELIWRAVWPRLDAPFGARLDPGKLSARHAEFKNVFNAAVESELARLEEQIARPIVTGSTIFSAQSSPSSP